MFRRSIKRFTLLIAIMALGGCLAALTIACGGEAETVTEVQTVVVEKQVTQVEKVIETVVVEKQVTQVEKVIETVVVEKVVEGKTVTVVETVVVEKPVTRTVKVVETVVIEKSVTQVQKVVETVVVPKVVVATPTAGPTAVPVTAHGTARVGHGRGVFPPVFRVSNSGLGLATAEIMTYGPFESLMRPPYVEWPKIALPNDEGIGTSWTIAPDASKITINIREGVQFHNGWGELTAHDVAWSYNDALREGSLFVRAAPMNRWMDGWEAVDDRTVVLNLKSLDPQWQLWMTNNANTVPPMLSKRAFDELGPDKFQVTDTGTGPFVVDEWQTGAVAILDRFPDYWREAGRAKVERVIHIDMPESATMEAALRAGEIDIADGVDEALIKDLVDEIGGRILRMGVPGDRNVVFSGNYWASNNRETGEAWPRQPGFTPDRDHPWIGDYFNEGGNDMESARKVRWAMAMAIDRDLIAQAVFGGIGFRAHAYGGFGPITTPEIWADKEDEWFVPFDPDMARQYLAEAGYRDGFEVNTWLGTAPAVFVEAIAQYWEAVGLTVTIDTTPYASGRPSVVARELNRPWYTHMGVGFFDGTNGRTARPSTGWQRGFELPDEITDLTYENFEEPDYDKRVRNNIAITDFVQHWMLLSSVYTSQGNLIAVAPSVLEWKPHGSGRAEPNSMETIVLR